MLRSLFRIAFSLGMGVCMGWGMYYSPSSAPHQLAWAITIGLWAFLFSFSLDWAVSTAHRTNILAQKRAIQRVREAGDGVLP